MRIEVVDEAIEKYVEERLTRGRKAAAEHFLSFAYLKFTGDELAEFRDKVCGFSRYYADFLRVMVNPLKGPETAWFASIATVFVYGAYLLTSVDSRNLGIFLVCGAAVNASTLLRKVAEKWCDFGVKIAIYDEIALLAEREIE